MNQLFNSRIKKPLLKDALNKNKNFIIIFTITLFLTFPVPLMIEFYYSKSSLTDYFTSDSILFLGVLTMALLIITPFLFFNYLTKKRSVDFMHSLPISRGSLFLTYTAASLLVVLIPFTLTYWTGYSIAYIFGLTGFQWEHLTIFVRAILLFAAVQAPTILVIMNTGTLSDSVIFSIILFAAPFIAFFAISEFTITYLLGISDIISTNILFYLSPATFFVASFAPRLISTDINLITLYWVVFSLLMSVISCTSYRRWKSEYSERPFNNDYFNPFVTSLFTVFLFIFMLSLFMMDYDSELKFLSPINLIIPILFTFVFYVILDFIKHRTAKYFLRATKHFAYIVIFSLSLSTIIFSTQGFGYAWRLPESNKINSVQIQYSLHTDESSSFNITLQDKDAIDAVIDIHSELVDRFKESNGFFTKSGDLRNITADLQIVYKNDNKRVMKRSFRIPDQFLDTTGKLLDIKEIAVKRHPILRDGNFSAIEPDVLELDTMNTIAFTQDNIKDFAKVYTNDLIRINQDSLISTDNIPIEYVFSYYLSSSEDIGFSDKYMIIIDSRFEETISFLKSLETTGESLKFGLMEVPYRSGLNFYTTPSYFFETDYESMIDKSSVNSYIDQIYLTSSTKSIYSYLTVLGENEAIRFALPLFK